MRRFQGKRLLVQVGCPTAQAARVGFQPSPFGGLVALGICLAYVTLAQGRGEDASQFVPVTMLITVGLFLLASLPTFLLLRERARPRQGMAGARLAAEAFSRLGETLAHARRFQDLWRFLVCLVFYQVGIQTVIALAAVYAQEAMGFTTRDTLFLILVVNVIASLGALAFGQVQDRLGHVHTLAVILAGWLVTVVLAWLAQGPGPFWFAANLVGLCLGSSQSAGRALIGYLSPPARAAPVIAKAQRSVNRRAMR